MTDNLCQWSSGDFAGIKGFGTQHNSSTYHPRTNAEAERFVQTFKKAIHTSEDDLIFRAQRFCSYKYTQHATTEASPAELFIGHKPRNVFNLIKPDINSAVQTR